MKLKFLLIIFMLMCQTQLTQALEATQYAILIDAGSTGSRVHLYSYHLLGSSVQDPNIQEINFYGSSSNKTKVPLTQTDLNHPLDTFFSPFNLALSYLSQSHVSLADVQLYIYSTAGMRLLDKAKRDSINLAITKQLNLNYPTLAFVDVKTIGGQIEALYDWLAVNYIKGSVSPISTEQIKTYGTIDVGGASAQIAYEDNSSSEPQSYTFSRLNLFGKSYQLYLNSILRAGQDQTRAQIIKDFSTSPYNSCYIAGSDSDVPHAQFNEQECVKEYQSLFALPQFMLSENPTDLTKSPVPPSDIKFLGTTSIYYTYNFFGAKQESDVTLDDLENSLHFCQESWESFKNIRPGFQENLRSQRCANAVYIHTLLSEGPYKLSQGNSLEVATSLSPAFGPTKDQIDIDWTLGAAVFIAGKGSLVRVF